MKVCMLVRTSYDHDARVRREAQALSDAGHEVVVLALPTSVEDRREREVEGGITVRRVRSRPLPVWQATWDRIGPWLVGSPPEEPEPGGIVGEAATATTPTSSTPGRDTPRSIAFLRRMIGALLISLREFRRDRAYRSAAIAERAEAYHAHDADTLSAARGASRACGARLVYDAHELVIGETEGRSWRSRARLGLTERRHVPRADAVITVCQSIAEAIADRHGVSPVVVRNIPPSAGSTAPVEELDADLRALAGLGPTTTIALFLGMASIERGVGTMLQALARLPEIDLVVLGPQFDGALARVRQAAARAGVEDRLHVLDPVRPEQVVATARAADVGLVLPHDVSLNHRFSLPNKLFEYIGAGLPVVASDLPELRRIVLGHSLGEVCDPTDPEAVATAIRKVTAEPSYATAARAARAELCWEREQQQLVDIYARLDGAA